MTFSHPTEQPADLASLGLRVSRLEAAEDIRRALNDYFYLVDGARIDELLDVYREDVAWSVSNIPPGSGRRLALSGRDQVRSVVERLGYGGFRHYGLNIDVNVDSSLRSANTTAYMLIVSRSPDVAGAVMVLGGLYEGTWVFDEDRWQIATWHVSNQWLVDGIAGERFFEGLREGTRNDGLPRWETT